MIENSKTIITLEEGEEIVIGDVTLTAGMSFEVLEAKKEADDKEADDEKDAEEKPADKKSDKDDEEEMDEKKKESTIYTVQEDVKVGDVILEKGDKFEIVEDEVVESETEAAEEVITEADAPDSSKDGEKAKDDEKDDGKKAKDDEKDTGAKAKDDEKDSGKKAKDDEKDSDKKAKDKEESVIYTVEEEVEIPGTDIVLEKGDKFTVL